MQNYLTQGTEFETSMESWLVAASERTPELRYGLAGEFGHKEALRARNIKFDVGSKFAKGDRFMDGIIHEDKTRLIQPDGKSAASYTISEGEFKKFVWETKLGKQVYIHCMAQLEHGNGRRFRYEGRLLFEPMWENGLIRHSTFTPPAGKEPTRFIYHADCQKHFIPD